MSYAPLRRLQRAHNAWLETLLTEARPALDAALRELFSACPELAFVAWAVSHPEHRVTNVEFHLRDGVVWRGDDGTVVGDPVELNPRRYRPLALLLVANGEVLAAAAMTCPAHVAATPDGALTVTTPDP
jgi:hypothetical protein